MTKVFVSGGSGFVGRRFLEMAGAAGYEAKALARSEESAEKIRQLGAEPVRGDLSNVKVLEEGMCDCDIVFHIAASTQGSYDEQYQSTVIGTENMLAAAKKAGVKRFVHVSTEAVLFGKDTPKLVNADETWRLPSKPAATYPATKGIAERRVLAANSPDFATIIVRPRMIWGKDDTSILKAFITAVKSGQFVWINGGKQMVSTTHIANVCEGLIKAAEKGRGGEIYFVTDGQPIQFRKFVTDLLATQNVTIPNRSIPYWLAIAVANGTNIFWKISRRKGEPTLNPFTVRIIGEETTINDSKARRELGYIGEMSREAGLAELRNAEPLAV